MALKLRKEGGYQVQLKGSPTRNMYEIKVMNGQQNKAKELFFIHFGNQPYSAEEPDRQKIFHREAANAVNVYKDSENSPLYVVRIEDIIPRKIMRIHSHLDKSPDPLHHSMYAQAESGDWEHLAQVSLDGWCEQLTIMQNGFLPTQKTPPKDYVVNKDLYDICRLARAIESHPEKFNKSYYLNAKAEVRAVRGH